MGDLSERKYQVPDEGVHPIPDKDYSASRVVIHNHEADKAGNHYDIRFDINNKAVSFATRKGLPTTPGKPVQLFRQPDHVVSYMNWEGQIPKGEYGAGKVSIHLDHPIILKSAPDKINFTIPEGESKGNYAIFKSGDTWMAVKKKELERAWTPKVKYKVKNDSIDNPNDYVTTEKLDGASFITKFNPNGISFTSQRKDVGDELIAREDKVPHLRDLIVPKEFHGMEVKGELWHDKGFNVLSGILNSKAPRAVETQKEKGLIKFAPFKILKGPNEEENLPYEKQLKILKRISDALPHYVDTPRLADKHPVEFYRDIGAKKGEGIVLVHKDTGESFKMKHRNDYDLKITGFVEGEGKYKGRGIGAINLADKNGKDVGKVGTGLSDELRVDMYKYPNKYMGKLVKVESRKPLMGKLREPSFLGLSIDTSEVDEVV